jgi:hypothetical protein
MNTEIQIGRAMPQEAYEISRIIVQALRETNARDYAPEIIEAVAANFTPDCVAALIRERHCIRQQKPPDRSLSAAGGEFQAETRLAPPCERTDAPFWFGCTWTGKLTVRLLGVRRGSFAFDPRADLRRTTALCQTSSCRLVSGNLPVQTFSGHPLRRMNVRLVPSQLNRLSPMGGTGLTAEFGR